MFLGMVEMISWLVCLKERRPAHLTLKTKKIKQMKRVTLAIFAASLLLFFSCNNEKTADATKESTVSTDNTPKKDEPWVPVDSATMMAKMMEYGTPGEMHKMLASWDGTWTGETTMWEYDGAAPKKSTGIGVNKMIMGGKYQHSTHKGEMMGMPFEGEGITAYDNSTKQFTSTWIDNWSTGIMTMKGNWDAGSKTLTFTGSYPDMFRPGKECHMKQVIKVIDDNTQQMDMYGPDQKTGKEYKMMEIVMKRKS